MKLRLYPTITSIASIFLFGCSTYRVYTKDIQTFIENSPPANFCQQTLEFANESELIDFYKEFFPNNRPELSFRFDTLHTKSRLFVNGNLGLKSYNNSRSDKSSKFNLNYELMTGIETRY